MIKNILVFNLLLLSFFSNAQEKTPKYYYNLSIEKINAGDIDGALQDIDNSIKLDSSYQDSYYLKAYIFYQTNRPKEAISEYDKLLTINPNHIDGLKNRALTKMRIYDLDGAIEDHGLRLELEPDNSVIYFDRGYCYSLKQDFVKAINDYSYAIQMNPNYKEAYANRGVAKINQLTTTGTIQPTAEQTKSACEDLIKAKELGDNSVEDMLFVYCSDKGKKKKNR